MVMICSVCIPKVSYIYLLGVVFWTKLLCKAVASRPGLLQRLCKERNVSRWTNERKVTSECSVKERFKETHREGEMDGDG